MMKKNKKSDDEKNGKKDDEKKNEWRINWNLSQDNINWNFDDLIKLWISLINQIKSLIE
jgi:hypothetical protein